MFVTRGQVVRTLALMCVVIYVLISLCMIPTAYDPGLAPKGVYFIASNLFNSEHIFPAYSDALLRVVDEIGHDRIFVSIYENNSKDRTPQMLQELDAKLAERGVARRIRHDVLPDNFYDMYRIDRLSTLRNRALEPLYDAQRGGMVNGHAFEKVVFLNDIFFTPETVYKLLRTEHGQYDQVCAIDHIWIGVYDTWVVRDKNAKKLRPLWPYFLSSEDKATVARRGVVPVNSCWNGLTAIDARWFLADTNSTSHAHEQRINSSSPAIAQLPIPLPARVDGFDDPATLPIRFRTSRDCSFESECLLTSLDMHRIARPIRPRIFINTDLAVAYDKRDFFMYDRLMRWPLVYPWHVLWEQCIANGLFARVGDIGRRPYTCEAHHRDLWVKYSHV